MPREPQRTYRAPDHVFEPFKAAAADRQESMSEAINRMLVAYVNETHGVLRRATPQRRRSDRGGR